MRFESGANCWMVDYFEDTSPVDIAEASLNQKVYIFKGKNSHFKVGNKVNGISIDSCQSCSVLLTDVVSSVEIVNCKSVQIQATGRMPTIQIDKTDGCQVYLSRQSMDINVYCAKSSEINVNYPGETDEDDMIEVPIPEQNVSKYDPATKKWVTKAVSHTEY